MDKIDDNGRIFGFIVLWPLFVLYRRGTDQNMQHEKSVEELKRNLKLEEENRIIELKRKYEAQIQTAKEKNVAEVRIWPSQFKSS